MKKAERFPPAPRQTRPVVIRCLQKCVGADDVGSQEIGWRIDRAVYGTGENVRDWLYVEDHARALRLLLEHGGPGETYNVGGNDERKNLEVVRMVCEILDDLCPRQCGRPYANLISFVEDRPGHDLRYAIDCSKLRREFDWRPETKFDQGLRSTVVWYLENEEWVKQSNYVGHRLGKIGER